MLPTNSNWKKIITAAQTRQADAHTIEHEPIASIDLMERASRAFVDLFIQKVDPSIGMVHVVCGTGNNGGDGLAIARMLLNKGYQVKAYLIRFAAHLSPDCETNRQRLAKLQSVIEITEEADLGLNEGLIIDAIFGSGLNRPVEGLAARVIEQINRSKLLVVAVDIPSGVFADEVNAAENCVQANATITFQRPKLSFMIPESGRFVGVWMVVHIGLSEPFIQAQDSPYSLIEVQDVATLLPSRPKFAHKGQFGRVQLVAGSKGKMGAATLSAEAILKAGAGLLTIHVPQVGLNVVQTVIREAMATVDTEKDYISEVPEMPQLHTICVGPGLGTTTITRQALESLIQRTEQPMVLDADALNIVAKANLLGQLPKGSVLTPHVGEFDRLFGESENGLERIGKLREAAVTFGLIVVLKGAHTAVGDTEGRVYFNTTGNAGMATAGSGDVLAGLITGLLAQGLSPKDAATAGVFLHGLAGDLAEKKCGKMSLMASNLLNELPQAINNVSVKSIF